MGNFTLSGTRFGLDFNPIPDRIRLVSDAEQSLRINPNDGTLGGTDTALSPAGSVVAAAYDRNFPRGRPASDRPDADHAFGDRQRGWHTRPHRLREWLAFAKRRRGDNDRLARVGHEPQ